MACKGSGVRISLPPPQNSLRNQGVRPSSTSQMHDCQMLEVTPCVDPLDELTSLEIYNSVWPHDAVTIDAVHSFRDSAQDYIDYLVREDGVILGSAAGAIFAYRARRVVTLITVLPGQRRRGAGTALYEAISRWASERGL